MTIEETNKIDIISRSKDHKKIFFSIIDATDINNEEERYNLFINKLKAYVGYIMSDQFKHEFPKNTPSDVTIILAYLNEPNMLMKQLNLITPRGNKEVQIAITFEKLNMK